MAIIRASRPKKHYTEIHDVVLRDKRLSYRARGVLGRLLSNDDGYSMTSEDLAEEGKEGRDAIRAALNELRDAGYIVTARHQGKQGRWETLTHVFDYPQSAEDGFPGVGNPATEDGFPGLGFPVVGLSGAKSSNTNSNTIEAAAASSVFQTDTPENHHSIPPKTMDGSNHCSCDPVTLCLIENEQDQFLYDALIEQHGFDSIEVMAKALIRTGKRPFLSNIRKSLEKKAAAARRQAAEVYKAEALATPPTADAAAYEKGKAVLEKIQQRNAANLVAKSQIAPLPSG